jgi:UDP-glucose 4-epimerase
MGKILVTGGAGYIGSQTNYVLLDQGFETVVFDNLSYGHREVVSDKSKFYRGDLLNLDSLEQVFRENKIEAVLHFAAFISVGESVEKPDIYYRNNVLGTINLLEVMKKYEVNKLVFSSTAAVYGLPENVPISENSPKMPINPYGRSKWMMEQIMDDFHQAYGLNSLRLRYFNACGADSKLRTGENHQPETHLIPLAIYAALNIKPEIKIYGDDYNTPDGTCIRDYIYIEDLAEAHVLALKKLLSGLKIAEGVNLGTKRGYSVKEVIQTVKEVTGRDFIVEVTDKRPGDPNILVADNQKAKDLLNWEANRSELKNIIQTAWQWHQKNLS